MRIRSLYKGYKAYFYKGDVTKFLDELDDATKEEVAADLEDIESVGIMPEQIGKQGKLYKPLDCRYGTMYEMKIKTRQKEIIRIYFHPDSKSRLVLLLLAEFKQGRSNRQSDDITKACNRLGDYIAGAR